MRMTLHVYGDPDEALDLLVKLFLNVMNSNLPVKAKRVTHKQRPDWLNNDIIEAIRPRDNAKQQKDDMQG